MSNFFSNLMLILFVYFCCASKSYAEKSIVGWLEAATLKNKPHYLVIAKIDTGADNSSLNAVNQEIYKRNGDLWVKFSLTTKSGREIIFQNRIIKTVLIKMKDGNLQRRNVIEINVCIGTISKKIKVNLVDRSHFKYQMLIGRSFLKGDFLVDSEKKFTVEPNCR